MTPLLAVLAFTDIVVLKYVQLYNRKAVLKLRNTVVDHHTDTDLANQLLIYPREYVMMECQEKCVQPVSKRKKNAPIGRKIRQLIMNFKEYLIKSLSFIKQLYLPTNQI